MKKRLIIVIILAICLVAGGLYVFQKESGPGILETVYGNVDIREATLAFRVSGKVEELRKDEGEPVQAGDLLARLDPVPYEQQLAQARADLEMKKSLLRLKQAGYRPEEIDQAQARLNEARAQLENARQTLARQEELQASKAGTDQQLDDARARHDQAQAAVQVAEANLRLMKAGFRQEEIDQAQAAVQLAQARVDEAQTRLADTRLLAPSAGIIRSRVLEKGAIAGAGAPVFVISLQENPWVRAYIAETSLGLIHPGMKVQVLTDTRRGKPYHGHIGFISPTAEFTPKSIHTEELRTNLVYRFRIIISDPDDQLRQGMPVTVRLTAAKLEE